ncbi:unnamed protein product [Meloidogyne enterolobii]|uniref:Uncharacterized protein n=1 Tax=Meloidogyne enterolobii TaxID=390850 RepID=A0ACB1ALA2_MELEN
MNHLPGLLETEPSVCSCLCGKDHIRVLNEQEKENFDLPTTVSTDSNKKSDQKVFFIFLSFLREFNLFYEEGRLKERHLAILLPPPLYGVRLDY